MVLTGTKDHTLKRVCDVCSSAIRQRYGDLVGASARAGPVAPPAAAARPSLPLPARPPLPPFNL